MCAWNILGDASISNENALLAPLLNFGLIYLIGILYIVMDIWRNIYNRWNIFHIILIREHHFFSVTTTSRTSQINIWRRCVNSSNLIFHIALLKRIWFSNVSTFLLIFIAKKYSCVNANIIERMRKWFT